MNNDAKSGNGIKQSLNDAFKALYSTIEAAYTLFPCAVIAGAALIAGITWITLQWSPLMIGTASLMVLIVSISIFAARDNFGEAMLSLIGGLLTILAFEWTPARYVTFMTLWSGFAFSALIIVCLKYAAKSEDIYRMASIRMTNLGEDQEKLEKQLKEIGTTTKLKIIGPIEIAEIIRVLAFRKLPIVLFSPCLNAVETLSVITKCDNKTIALFLADFFISFSADSDSDPQQLVDLLYEVIKDVPVSPEEFFLAFEASRRLLISRSIPPIEFLEGLKNCLSSGITPADIYGEMNKRINMQLPD